jgi:hypothetical protein
MARGFKSTAIAILIVVLLVPTSIAITLMLTPFWRWLESTLSIESIGHSGPSAWCYYGVLSALLAVALLLAMVVRRRVSE